MTDYELIRALKGSILNAKSVDCKVWSIEVYKLENALDLINRQKATIERLEDMVRQDEGVLPKYENYIKSEAIKEFAKMLIDKSDNGIISISDIHDYVKEKTEEI